MLTKEYFKYTMLKNALYKCRFTDGKDCVLCVVNVRPALKQCMQIATSAAGMRT